LLHHPEAALELLRSVAARWRSVMEQMQDMAFLDISGRLAKVLLNLDSPAAPPFPDRVAAIAGHVSQSQLASLIGASRESVNKALQAFAHEDAIELHEGRVEVLDPDKLRSYFKDQP
jgi:CRP-like cAMP-binding protein